LLAAIATGITSWNMCRVSDNLIIAVPVAIISGFIVFIVVSYILRVEELRIFLSIFSKHKKS
jgi:CRISPR/Cas system CMR subunit Cmr4 (Cas7 group RAMP superfamily)